MTRSAVRAPLLLSLLLILPAPLLAAVAPAKDATAPTRDANAAVLKELPFADRGDFADARHGFIAALPEGVIAGTGPRPVWNMKAYDFLDKEEAPATVNPSLWRQARLNAIHGLFRITDRVYQLRGLDISNMTIVEGDSGLIVIDTLLTAETAHAALELITSTGRTSRWSRSSTATAMSTISAASKASSTRPICGPAGSRSMRPTASWRMRWPRTSSPAMP